MNQNTEHLREQNRNRLIGLALAHLQLEAIASAVIPIPGGDRVIAIGTPARVRALLGSLGDGGAVAVADARHLPGWERGIATVTMTGHQLREALGFLNPGGDDEPDERDDELTFGIVQVADDAGNVSAGLCCWNGDSDGVLPLDAYPVVHAAAEHAIGCGGTGKLNEKMPCLGCDACPRAAAAASASEPRCVTDMLQPDWAVNPEYCRAQASGREAVPLTSCAAGRDGECGHAKCPQLRDGEPRATGRHCPLDSEGGRHD